ncbi:hypothetical protein [Deinococcus sp. NW-56]|uniref:hypothetical protein n=1 Tax=Deinococcus sp. NW-56 TaxID=2080419 RepID=UPI00131A3D11|nr:hypothetical protein [Deinococcus sp. NW-56]
MPELPGAGVTCPVPPVLTLADLLLTLALTGVLLVLLLTDSASLSRQEREAGLSQEDC